MTLPTTPLARAEPRGSCHREGTFAFPILTLLAGAYKLDISAYL